MVVGTRSAVFAPLGSPGLIWVEDEEDPSLKEEEEPRYHAREVAWMRARHGSATGFLVANGVDDGSVAALKGNLLEP